MGSVQTAAQMYGESVAVLRGTPVLLRQTCGLSLLWKLRQSGRRLLRARYFSRY